MRPLGLHSGTVSARYFRWMSPPFTWQACNSFRWAGASIYGPPPSSARDPTHGSKKNNNRPTPSGFAKRKCLVGGGSRREGAPHEGPHGLILLPLHLRDTDLLLRPQLLGPGTPWTSFVDFPRRG